MTVITVSSTAESEKILRGAILNANYRDTIRFDSALTNTKITLTSGQVKMTKDLNLKALIFTDGRITTGIADNSNAKRIQKVGEFTFRLLL